MSVYLDSFKACTLYSSTADRNIFERYLRESVDLFKKDNSAVHLCCYFLPFHPATQSFYLVHHRKAGAWIPPGGHCEPNESPLETAIRECAEELHYNPDSETVTPFATSVTLISDSGLCKKHLNYWYLVRVRDRIPFQYDVSEFYSARWMDRGDTQSAVERTEIKDTLNLLKWDRL